MDCVLVTLLSKQHCCNKQSMITSEAWTPVIINSQCSSIKWIERSAKYVLPRIQVCMYVPYVCIRDLPKQEFSKVLHGLLSDILKRENDCIKTPLILDKVELKVK